MKRFSSLAVGLVAFVATSAYAQGQKIGVIEVQRIVQESAVGKESLVRVQKLQSGKQDELARRTKELRDLETKIQEQQKSLSEEANEKLQKDYQAKALDLKRFQDDAQRELEEAQRKELKQLEERIMPVIDTLAKEQGFALVFNKFQSGLLFADQAADLTDTVITRFNAQIASPAAKPAAQPSAPKSDAKPAPAKAATPAPKKN